MCTRKNAYANEKAAQAAVYAQAMKFHCRFVYYRCEYCGLWHTATHAKKEPSK